MLLEESLVPLGKPQAELARELGKTPAAINEIVKGKRGVNAEMALRSPLPSVRLQSSGSTFKCRGISGTREQA
jgi:predicted transcriptional regulator